MVHWMWFRCGYLVIWWYSAVTIDAINHGIFVDSLCQVEGTHWEHVQLVEVAHVHVDGTQCIYNVKQVKNTQFEVGSWQVADFDELYFVGQVCHAERRPLLMLVNYLHRVVCRQKRCIRRLIRNFSRGYFTNMLYPRTHANTRTRARVRGPAPANTGAPTRIHTYTCATFTREFAHASTLLERDFILEQRYCLDI